MLVRPENDYLDTLAKNGFSVFWRQDNGKPAGSTDRLMTFAMEKSRCKKKSKA